MACRTESVTTSRISRAYSGSQVTYVVVGHHSEREPRSASIATPELPSALIVARYRRLGNLQDFHDVESVTYTVISSPQPFKA
jgi:hypothetical protein